MHQLEQVGFEDSKEFLLIAKPQNGTITFPVVTSPQNGESTKPGEKDKNKTWRLDKKVKRAGT